MLKLKLNRTEENESSDDIKDVEATGVADDKVKKAIEKYGKLNSKVNSEEVVYETDSVQLEPITTKVSKVSDTGVVRIEFSRPI